MLELRGCACKKYEVVAVAVSGTKKLWGEVMLNGSYLLLKRGEDGNWINPDTFEEQNTSMGAAAFPWLMATRRSMPGCCQTPSRTGGRWSIAIRMEL